MVAHRNTHMATACSATGAAEVQHMAYMTRLGLWGPRTPFVDFAHFKGATRQRGITMMQLVALHLKSQGAYLCRMLSFEGASFTLERAELTAAAEATYTACCELWRDIIVRTPFTDGPACIASPLKLCAGVQGDVHHALALQGMPRTSRQIICQMWGTHQSFFRGVCLAAKVDRIVELAQERLAEGYSVVLGLQATGALPHDAVPRCASNDPGILGLDSSAMRANLKVQPHMEAIVLISSCAATRFEWSVSAQSRVLCRDR